MQRIRCAERPHWRQLAEEYGFTFHTIDGEAYWDETAYYRFSLHEIENDIETPTENLHALCMDAVEKIVHNEQHLQQLCIPAAHWDLIAHSWQQRDFHLYGRMDFSYHGAGSSAKLLELNYDTPTSVYETGFFQWVWLEQQLQAGVLPAGADQFNSLQEKLIERFSQWPAKDVAALYFSCVRESIEDAGTIAYLRDCAHQAGLRTETLAIEDIGITADDQFCDLQDKPVNALFKLYPWEFIWPENYAQYLRSSRTQFIEPPWKAVLSNKGILPLLWQWHKGHPNLLESYFLGSSDSPLPPAGWVSKPLYSREGANIALHSEDGTNIMTEGSYAEEKRILQRVAPLPCTDGNYALIGSWVVGDSAAGMGIREDNTLVTRDTSRFVPHVIVD
jgi:glutathionylspermidine synthase